MLRFLVQTPAPRLYQQEHLYIYQLRRYGVVPETGIEPVRAFRPMGF
jgi:hypothetical protein